MKRRIPALLCICVLLLAQLALSVSSIDLRGFMTTEFYTLDGGNVALPYRVYLPEGVEWSADGSYTAKAGEDYTLLIWLHDEDLRGDDNTAHISDEEKNVLLSATLTHLGEHCIVIAPQCPMGETWDSISSTLDGLLHSVYDATQRGSIGENTRVLLGGIGMGASYGYTFIGTKQNLVPIDAAYLIGGTCEAKASSTAFAGIDIYAFVASAEKDPDAKAVVALAAAVNEAAGETFRVTECEGVGHELWLPAFAEEAMLHAFLGLNTPAEEETTEPATESETETVSTPSVTEDTEKVQADPTVTDSDTEDTPSGVPDTDAAPTQLILIVCALVLVVVLVSLMQKEKNAGKKKKKRK